MAKELKCKKCNMDMKKKGKMNSGNSSYDIYICENCHTEVLVCTGINLG